MSVVGQTGWLQRLRVLGVVLHLAVVLAAPFEHHDLVCHLKQPFHCTACVSSPLSSSPKTVSVVGAWTLADAGSAVHDLQLRKGAVLSVSSTGRSPPLAS